MRKKAIFAAVFLFSIACFITAGAPAVHAASYDEFSLTIGPEDFTWKEFRSDGSRLLKESGTLVGIDFHYWTEFQNHLTIKPAAQLFFGTVDYEGHTQSGIPANTDVDYFGLKLQGDVGYLARVGNATIEPFAGIAIRTWSRDINDGFTIFGQPVVGYTEWWTMFYGRAGIRGDIQASSALSIFAEAGAKLPIDTSNYIDDPNISYESITLHPKSNVTFFAEAGIRAKMFTVAAFYDRFRFRQSDVVWAVDSFTFRLVPYVQPKSESDIYGIRIGVLF